MRLDLDRGLDIEKAKAYMSKLIDSKSKIKNRSISLNSYLHVCITLFAIEFGYNIEEAKTFLKRECGFMVYEKSGSKFLKSTAKMDNKECSQFVEWIRNYSAGNGCYIPDAEEYKTNRYEIDKDINNHKQYL